MSKPSILRWGILGAARVNERLLPAIVAAENAKLVAIASRRDGAAAEILSKYAPQETDVATLNDPEALLDREDVDAIYLPIANEEHAQWALKAMAKGKHVLIEKPMALKVSDIEAIIDAAQQYNVTVMEGFMYCFHPQHQYVRDLIDSGAIGEVRTVKTSYSFPMKPARLYRIERDMDNGGGAMWDIGPYAIHSARKWFDQDPIAVAAMAKLNDSGADVSMSGILDFDDGKYAHFDMSFERARRSEYEIIGTLGGVKCDTVWQNPDDAPVINWWTDAGEQHQVELPMANHFVLEIEHLSDCILNNKPPELSLKDALANCKTIVAAIQSVRQAKQIKIV
ncbi:MAG: oxidoreductase [Methylophaga sp.]|nr:MAG: oxidoreductase [Methylophaga sp.]